MSLQPWSIKGMTAYALALFPLPVVHRGTIRAMLPKGVSHRRLVSPDEASRIVRAMTGAGNGGRKKNINPVSDVFIKSLKDFDRDGLIMRGHEFVKIIDSQGLLDEALREADRLVGDGHIGPLPLDIRRCVEELNQAVADTAASDPRIRELRRQELLALQRMMESGRGYNWSGRGSVRLVPKSATI